MSLSGKGAREKVGFVGCQLATIPLCSQFWTYLVGFAHLPSTLAFFKAVKESKTSGIPSLFTSKSSGGNRTPSEKKGVIITFLQCTSYLF